MDHGTNGSGQARLAAFLAACVALPWLGPWASGPSASMDQWLLTGLCAAALILLGSFRPAGGDGAAFWRAVAAGWLLAALGSTLVALCQYYGVAEHFAGFMSASAGHQPYANLRQRNQFASLTVMGTAAMLWFAVRGAAFVPALAAICCLAAGNAITSSRVGALELLALTFLVSSWSGPQRPRLLRLMLGAVAAYVLAATVLPQLADRPSTYGALGRFGQEEGCLSRRILWSNVLDLIALKPWLGWGWGELDFAHYITLYPGARFCDVLDNAHNFPLQIAVELGVPASVLACALAAWFVAARAPWREQAPARRLAWSVLALIGIHSAFEYPLWYGPFLMASVLCVQCLWARPGASPAAASAGMMRPLGIAAGLALGAVVLAYGWQYRLVSQIYLPAEQRLPAYRQDTLGQIRAGWAFRDQALFAELTTTPLTQSNAGWTFDAASRLLHFSPEPRVIEKLIESAVVLKRDEEAAFHMQRYRAAFPKEYARWIELSR